MKAAMRLSLSICPESTPIHKATIIPRGGAFGMVQTLPERDQISQSYEQLIAMLAMAMGGRVAEELDLWRKQGHTLALLPTFSNARALRVP